MVSSNCYSGDLTECVYCFWKVKKTLCWLPGTPNMARFKSALLLSEGIIRNTLLDTDDFLLRKLRPLATKEGVLNYLLRALVHVPQGLSLILFLFSRADLGGQETFRRHSSHNRSARISFKTMTWQLLRMSGEKVYEISRRGFSPPPHFISKTPVACSPPLS